MEEKDVSFVKDMMVIFTVKELDRLQGDVNLMRNEKKEYAEGTQALIKTMRKARSEFAKYGKIKSPEEYPSREEIEKFYGDYVKLEMDLMQEGKKAAETLQKEKVLKILSKAKK